jgi:hypothetical protein
LTQENRARPLSAIEIRRHLEFVGEELGEAGPDISILIVGGARMSFVGLREMTVDVDTISSIDEELSEAIEIVAAKTELPGNWINSSARPFAPDEIHDEDCEVLLQHKRLTVLGVSLEDLFIMKLSSNRRRDHNDLSLLWPHVSFETPAEVVKAFRLAYPNAETDDFLEDWVAEIIERSARLS